MPAVGGSQVRCVLGSGKEEGGCGDADDASCFAFGRGETPPIMPLPNRGRRQQRWLETVYAFLSIGTCGGNNGRQIDNRGGEAIATPLGLRRGHRHNKNNN